MKRLFHRYKYDFLSIVREPIMIVFAILPLFIIILFRLGLSPLSDFLENKIEFVLIDFKIYFIVFTFVMTPYMTGVLAGFLMLDERDGNIFELLLTTPSGFSGYLISRLFIPITLTTIESIFTHPPKS